MSKICKIPNCGPTSRLYLGMCQMHYRRTRLYGDPNFVTRQQRRPKDKSKITLFEDHAEVELTQGRVAIIDFKDVAQISQHTWNWSSSTGYAYSKTAGTSMQQFLIGKAPAGYEIDHDNRNKLDNRRKNISHKTEAENCYNKERSDNRKSISFHKASKKWQAFIGLGREQLYVGLYETKELASKAQIEANALFVKLGCDIEKFKPSWKLMRTAKADTEKRDE